ncbi:unnamed protein product, partial [Ectocarpus sp. 12 AP-2014]
CWCCGDPVGARERRSGIEDAGRGGVGAQELPRDDLKAGQGGREAIQRQRRERAENTRTQRESPAHRHHHASLSQGSLSCGGEVFGGLDGIDPGGDYVASGRDPRCARRPRQAQPRPCREVVRKATESFGGGGELVGVPACSIAFPPFLEERRPGAKTRSDDVCSGASDARGGGPHAGAAGAHGEPPVVGKPGGFALQPPPLPGAVDSREGVGGGRRQPGVRAVAGEHPLRRFPGRDLGPADPCENGGGGAGKQPGVGRDAGAAAGGAPPAGLALPQHVLLPGLERAKHPGQPTGPAQVRACGAPIERQPPREKRIEV